jgi:hypothetical protein
LIFKCTLHYPLYDLYVIVASQEKNVNEILNAS